jgi:hypothetical protein
VLLLELADIELAFCAASTWCFDRDSSYIRWASDFYAEKVHQILPFQKSWNVKICLKLRKDDMRPET